MTLSLRRLLLAVALAALPQISVAADPPGEEKPAAAKPAAAKEEKAEPKTPAALIEALRSVGEEVQGANLESPEDIKLAVKLVSRYADQIRAHADATAEQKTEATIQKLQTYLQAAQLDKALFAEGCKKYCAELAKAEPKSEAGQVAGVFPFVLDVLQAEKLPADAPAQLRALAKQFPNAQILPRVYEGLASRLKDDGKIDAALALLKEGVAHVKSVDNESAAEELGAAVARMEMIGKPLEFVGATLEGKPFDLKSLKGKVVLIDFWATWCGPCVEFMPQVKKTYEKYHAEGFEVVAVSLDDDLDALKAFVKEEKLPWPQLISPNEDERGPNAPLAKKFHVNAVPTMFLVGRDGNFITEDLHGDDLLPEAVEKALRGGDSAPAAAPAPAPKK